MNLPGLRSLKLRVDGSTAHLTFDHGKANEMGRIELDDLRALAAWLEEAPVRALISTSYRKSPKGTPIFIAGANVTERHGWSHEEVKAHVRFQRETLARLRQVPVLHVIVVDGVAFGWGTEYLLTGDYRIAGPQALFGLPETGLGILPGAGGTSELARLVGPNHALRLGLTGETIHAQEASRIGLVDEAAESFDAAMARALALVDRVELRSPTAMAAFKRALLAGLGRPYPEASALEARAYEHCVDSGDAAVGRAAFDAIRAGEGARWGAFHPWRP